MKHTQILRTMVAALLCLMIITPSLADVLILPSNLKVIEQEAFFGDESIDEVYLPEGIEEIGDRAFAESGLTKINLPATLHSDSIGENAFDSGVDISARKGTEAYDWAVEHGFINEDQPVLPETPATAFSYLSNGDGTYTVTQYNGSSNTIVIPKETPDGDPVTAIDSSAFRYGNMTALEIPGTIKTIPDRAFNGCTKIQTLILHEGTESIGEWNFLGAKIETLSIPASVKNIGAVAFYGCTSLSSVTFLNGIKTIGSQSFSHCGLTKVRLPGSLSFIADDAFDLNIEFEAEAGTYSYDWAVANGYITVPYVDPLADYDVMSVRRNGELIGWALTGYHGTETDVVIPAGQDLIGIDRYAFHDNDEITSLVIPEGITYITDWAFFDCENLTSVSLPQSLETIGIYAFGQCKKLNGVNLPDGLESIGENAFEHCTSLSAIRIPASVRKIDAWAFDHCENLTQVELSEGLECIGAGAFDECGFESVEIPESVTEIEQYAFHGCSSLQRIVIPTGITAINSSLFGHCSALTDVRIPETVTSIGMQAFECCISLESIDLPAGVTDIGAYAFTSCTGLKRMTIPEGVSTISRAAFGNCTALAEIKIPDGVTVIDGMAFFGCSSLCRINLPGGLQSISEHAFKHCTSLESIIIPSGTVQIGMMAFMDCRSLKSVAVPASVKVISKHKSGGYYNTPDGGGRIIEDGDAFSGCTALRAIYCVPDSDAWAFFANEEAYRDLLIPWSESSTTESVISGRVVTTTGGPVPDVGIHITNKGTGQTHYTYTDQDGNWSFFAAEGAHYQINYEHPEYEITPAAQMGSAGNHLLTYAAVKGIENNQFTFIMKDEHGNVLSGDSAETDVGKAVTFEVNAPNAQRIQLIVDGIKYEQYDVENHSSFVFRRVINKAGIRSIRVSMMKVNEDEFSDMSTEQVLHVYKEEDLKAPRLYIPDTYDLDSDTPLRIRWDAVPHAASYRVYLYYDGIRIYPQNSDHPDVATTDNNYYDINKNLLFSGEKWSAEVVAIGQAGWNSSSSSTEFFSVYRIIDNVLTDVKYNNTSIADRQRYAAAGMKRFRVDYTGKADGLQVYVDNEPVDYTLEGFYVKVSIPEGIHQVQFALGESKVESTFAVYTYLGVERKTVVENNVQLLNWPDGNLTEPIPAYRIVESEGTLGNYDYVTYNGKTGFVLSSAFDTVIPDTPSGCKTAQDEYSAGDTVVFMIPNNAKYQLIRMRFIDATEYYAKDYWRSPDAQNITIDNAAIQVATKEIRDSREYLCVSRVISTPGCNGDALYDHRVYISASVDGIHWSDDAMVTVTVNPTGETPHEHLYDIYYNDLLEQKEYCIYCEPRTKEQKARDLANANRFAANIGVNLFSYDDKAGFYLLNIYKANNSPEAILGSYAYLLGSISWVDLMKTFIPGSEEVNAVKKKTVQDAVQQIIQGNVIRDQSSDDWGISVSRIEDFVDKAGDVVEWLLENTEDMQDIHEFIMGLYRPLKYVVKGKATHNAIMFRYGLTEFDAMIDDLQPTLSHLLTPSKTSFLDNFLDEVEGSTTGWALNIALFMIKTGIDIDEYYQLSAQRKEMVMLAIQRMNDSIKILDEIQNAFSNDSYIASYCTEAKALIYAYAEGDFWGDVLSMNIDQINKSIIILQNIRDASADMLVDAGITALFKTVCGTAGAIVTIAASGFGWAAEMIWGTHTGIMNYDYIANLYVDIYDFTQQYASDYESWPDAVKAFASVYVAELKVAGLELAKEATKNSDAIDEYDRTIRSLRGQTEIVIDGYTK